MIAEAPPEVHHRQPQRETSPGKANWTTHRKDLLVWAGDISRLGSRPAWYALFPFSPKEQQLITELRKLSQTAQEAILRLVDEMVDKEDSERLIEEGLLLSAESFMRDEQEREQGS